MGIIYELSIGIGVKKQFPPDLLQPRSFFWSFVSAFFVQAEGMVNIQDEMDAEMLTLLDHLRGHDVDS